MARPYGVGLYGRHAYSTGTFLYPLGIASGAVELAEAQVVLIKGVLADSGPGPSSGYSVPFVGYLYKATGASTVTSHTEPSISRMVLAVGEALGPEAFVEVARIVRAAALANIESEGSAYSPLMWPDEAGGQVAWTDEDTMGSGWAPQTKSPPRRYGRGLYGVLRYGRFAPILEDEWNLIR